MPVDQEKLAKLMANVRSHTCPVHCPQLALAPQCKHASAGCHAAIACLPPFSSGKAAPSALSPPERVNACAWACVQVRIDCGVPVSVHMRRFHSESLLVRTLVGLGGKHGRGAQQDEHTAPPAFGRPLLLHLSCVALVVPLS
jgi:hypothetical protein